MLSASSTDNKREPDNFSKAVKQVNPKKAVVKPPPRNLKAKLRHNVNVNVSLQSDESKSNDKVDQCEIKIKVGNLRNKFESKNKK